MRHRKAGRKFSRTSAHRKAMFSNMVTSLFEHEAIRTTDAKAKELRRIAERLITQAKKGAAAEGEARSVVDEAQRRDLVAKGVHARRLAAKTVRDRFVLQKLFDEIQERFATRPGGYTRITKLGYRQGDQAPVSLIELLPSEDEDDALVGDEDEATEAAEA